MTWQIHKVEDLFVGNVAEIPVGEKSNVDLTQFTGRNQGSPVKSEPALEKNDTISKSALQLMECTFFF